MQDLTLRLQNYLASAIWQQLQALCRLADEQGVQLYLVGGLVRDCLLGMSSTDLDIVVVGDAPTFAQTVQQAFNGRLHIYERFRTATWFPQTTAYFIDFITARREIYSAPGALPTITPSTIEDDLQRRDFPVNAMAVRLDGRYFGQLLDPLHGLTDLEMGVIRVLHEQSFQDDATRMWRTVRYEQRLSFMIEPHTAAWLTRDLPYLQTISGERISHELILVLQEERRQQMLQRLDSLGILAYVHPELHWSAEAGDAFDRLSTPAAWPLYLAVWLAFQADAVRAAVLHFWHFEREIMALVERTATLREQLAATKWTSKTAPSVIEKVLRPFAAETEVLTAVLATLPPKSVKAQLLTRYRAAWRHVQTAVNGHTLRAQGVPPGPLYREILDQLLAAKLDGAITTAEEELTLLREILQKRGF